MRLHPSHSKHTPHQEFDNRLTFRNFKIKYNLLFVVRELHSPTAHWPVTSTAAVTVKGDADPSWRPVMEEGKAPASSPLTTSVPPLVTNVLNSVARSLDMGPPSPGSCVARICAVAGKGGGGLG